MSGYQYLPTVYPPSRVAQSRWRPRIVLVASGVTLCLLVLLAAGTYASGGRLVSQVSGTEHNAQYPTTGGNSAYPQADPFYRDAYPLRTIRQFWQTAEEEIADRNLDTCGDKYGRGLIEAYARTRLDYCKGETEITCTSVKNDEMSRWWPVPEAPCLSRGLKADQRSYFRVNSEITAAGRELDATMGHEKFIGRGLLEANQCGPENDRTLFVVPRQDQWNPFHVGEDMVTTLVTALVATELDPSLADRRVQFVFDDDFGLEGNHFVPMWDRMGAWPPRRLSLDPWREECLAYAIHSVGAGVSILSANGVSSATGCASSVTWAASHYYRHLFSLQNPQAFNIVWLSRAKFDRWAQSKGDWSNWRSVRHIENEDELLRRIERGLKTLDDYEDISHAPERWTLPGGIRFASIDPSVHSLETQIRMIGHASIVIGSHGGAMGLCMFLPPGRGAVLELQVPEVNINRHFEIMATHMGHGYEQIETERVVDVEKVWTILDTHIRRMHL